MFFKKKARKVIGIDGMHCDRCREKIEQALGDLIDVSKVRVDLNRGIAYVYYDHSVDDVLLSETIEKLGYVVTGIKEEN